MWQIGKFQVDPRQFVLMRDGHPIQIQRRPFDILLYLVERRDRVVARNELLAHVWGGVAVSDGAISTAVYELRSALDDLDRRGADRWIQTVRGRGFRFRGPEPVRTEAGASRRGLPFVCRGATRAELIRTFQDAERGRGSITLIEGVAGMGKTRLVEEALAERDAGTIAQAWCEVGAPVYWPWWQLVQAFAKNSIPSAVALAASWSDPAASTDGDRHQFARARAIEHVLTDAARARLRVIVIEDVHWADGPSLALLESLVPRIRVLSLALVVTRRTEETETRPTRLGTLTGVTRQVLGPLTPPDIYPLVQALHARLPSPDVVGYLLERSSGIPLYLIEIASTLKDLDRAPTGTSTAITSVFSRKLDALSAATRRAVAIAALCGERFDVLLVEDAAGAELPEDRSWIREAESAGLLAPDPALPTRFVFHHALVRDAAEAMLDADERARFHLRIGEALERRHPDPPSHVTTALARHFAAAARVLTDPSRALRHALRAGRDAAALRAWPSVALHASHALGWADRLTPGEERDLLVLDSALLRCAAISGLEDYVAETGALLERIAPELARRGGPAERALAASFRYACARHAPADADLARIADPVSDIDWLAPAVDGWRAALATLEGRFEQAARISLPDPGEGPISVFRGRAGWDPWCEQLGLSAFACFALGDDREAIARSTRAIERAEAQGDVRIMIWMRYLSMLLCELRRDWPRMSEVTAPMDALGEAHGITSWLGAGSGFAIMAALRRAGKPDEVGCQRIGNIIRSRGLGPNSSPRTLLLLIASRMLAWGGDEALARATLDDAIGMARRTSERFLWAELLRERAKRAITRGDVVGARGDWARAVEIANAQGAVVFELRTRADRIEAGEAESGDRMRLTAIRDRLGDSLGPHERERLANTT